MSSYSGTVSYGYDTVGQLNQESSTRTGGYSESFVYDAAGNPTTFRGVGQGYNSDNQTTALTFDGDGNPTSWNGQALTFDANSDLTALGSTLTAGYNADGQRAWKQTSAGKTYFLYAGDAVVCELDSNGNVLAANTWGVNGLVSRFTTSPGRSVFYTWDRQGGCAQRLDSSGNILGSYAFDGYGNRQSTDNSTDPYSGYGGQWGYYRDAETGLSLLGARYYDPGQGRFLNRDPIGYDGGFNLYGYCENDPIMYADPTGLYIDITYDPHTNRLTIYDSDHPGEVTTIPAFSGGGHYYDGGPYPVGPPSYQTKGSIPAGNYLIGNGGRGRSGADPNVRLPKIYGIYGPNGKGGYSEKGKGVVTGPDGQQTTRNGFELHPGRISFGCLTVPSDYAQNDPNAPPGYVYPDSKYFNILDRMLQHTRPYKYKGQTYKGKLHVKS